MEGLNPRKVVSLLFIVGIAVVFTLQFGPGGAGFGASNQAAPGSAAVVNGKEIPLKAYAIAWSRQMEFFRGRGTPVSEAALRQVGMPQQVLEQLVDRELLAQAAERRGITPSDAEVRKLIHEQAAFQKDGKFDFERYKQVLRDFHRKTPAEFENELRRDMAAGRLMEMVAAGAVVSEDEVRARFEKQNNQVKLVFARFLPSMYTAQVQAPSAEQLAAFKAAQQKQISDYYETNRFTYNQPARLKARQLVLNLPAGATEEQKAQVLARAEALRKRAEGGEDFATLVREASESPAAKETGGDVGWVTAQSGRLPPPVADAAFALQPGALTQPVAAQDAVYVVKVEEKQPEQNKKLEEVADEIATTLYKQQQAKELARAQAQQALAALQAGGQTLQQRFPPEKAQPALLRFETETRPEAVETDSFPAAGEAVPHLGPAPELASAAFATPGPQVLGEVYPAGEGFVVAQVLERKRPDDAEFTQKKDELRAQARRAKGIELQESFLRALKQTGEVKTNPNSVEQVLGAG